MIREHPMQSKLRFFGENMRKWGILWNTTLEKKIDPFSTIIWVASSTGIKANPTPGPTGPGWYRWYHLCRRRSPKMITGTDLQLRLSFHLAPFRTPLLAGFQFVAMLRCQVLANGLGSRSSNETHTVFGWLWWIFTRILGIEDLERKNSDPVDSHAGVGKHINCILDNFICVHLSTTRVHHKCTPVTGRAKGKRFTVKLQPWTACRWQYILPQSIDAQCSLSVITAWRCISYKELVESGWLTGYSYIPYTTGGPSLLNSSLTQLGAQTIDSMYPMRQHDKAVGSTCKNQTVLCAYVSSLARGYTNVPGKNVGIQVITL